MTLLDLFNRLMHRHFAKEAAELKGASEDVYCTDLLKKLSGFPEGKALVDFSRKHEVKFVTKEGNGVIGGTYSPETNTVAVMRDANTTEDRQLSVLAHELRHAYQFLSVPKLGFISSVKANLGCFREFVFFGRTIEADAFSYQYCMALAMKNAGILSNPQAAMKRPPGLKSWVDKADDWLDRFRTAKGRSQRQEKIEARRQKIGNFLDDFATRHGNDPLTPAARAEAFWFYAGKDIFDRTYDPMYSARYAAFAALSCDSMIEASFNHASARSVLPKVKDVLSAVSQVGVSDPARKFIPEADFDGFEKRVLSGLSPLLRRVVQWSDVQTAPARGVFGAGMAIKRVFKP